MDAPRSCFVDEVTVPIRLYSTVNLASHDTPGLQVHNASTLEELESFFSRTMSRGSNCYLSISQRHSWGPLHITEPMLRFLSGRFDLKSLIWDLASSFYARNSEIESHFCIPFTIYQDGPITEVSYTVRYPELKPIRSRWAIRQTGIYQKLNAETGQTLFILFNPTPASKLEQTLERLTQSPAEEIKADLLWLHKELFRVYMPAWRRYNAHWEETFLPIANNAVVTFIEEPTDNEHRHLTQLAFLESKLIQIPVILQATQDVLGELSSLVEEHLWIVYSMNGSLKRPISCQFKQHRRNCQAYARIAQSLQERAQRITQLLANTLSFREQLNAKSQNESMLKLNKSAVFITTLTLLYLPPSFVATFFGMNFFELDKEQDQIISTSMIWVFALCSVLLTAGTFLLYHLLLDGTLLGQLGDIVLNLRKIKLRRAMPMNIDHELDRV